MITPAKIEKILVDLKPFLSKEFGVETIGYFGSYSTGNYHQHSDIDILVSFNKKVGWKFFDLKYFLEEKIGKRVDIVTERSIKPQWKENILEEVKYI